MKLTMILRCAPDSPACGTAAAILRSWLAAGHEVTLLFLHASAVGLCRVQADQGAVTLLSLVSEGNIPTLACVGSAAKQGACNDRGEPVGSWASAVHPGSLGELASAVEISDRVVTIG